jgi:hypothetical protein
MSTSASDEWRPTDHGLPADFLPPPGVRYLIHGNVLTILDDRPGITPTGPTPESEREENRRFRRRLEGPPEDEPPSPATS